MSTATILGVKLATDSQVKLNPQPITKTGREGFIDSLRDQCPYLPSLFQFIKNNPPLFSNGKATLRDFVNFWDKAHPNFQDSSFRFIPLKKAAELCQEGVPFFAYSDSHKDYVGIIPGSNDHLTSEELKGKFAYGWDFIHKILYISKPNVVKDNGIKFTQVKKPVVPVKEIQVDDIFLKVEEGLEFFKAYDVEFAHLEDVEKELALYEYSETVFNKKEITQNDIDSLLKQGFQFEGFTAADEIKFGGFVRSKDTNKTLYGSVNDILYIVEPDKFHGEYKQLLHFIDRNYFGETMTSFSEIRPIDFLKDYLKDNCIAYNIHGKEISLIDDFCEVIIIPENIPGGKILSVYKTNDRMAELVLRETQGKEINKYESKREIQPSQKRLVYAESNGIVKIDKKGFSAKEKFLQSLDERPDLIRV